MAKKLDTFPEDLRVRTADSYPWNEWFDGSVWELTKGEDYVIKTKSFISNAQAKARTRGGTLRTGVLPDDKGVVVQYRTRPLGGDRPAKNPPAPLVRTWAKANGWPDLADRGNLSAEIIAAYQAANGGSQ